jgi:hypothetical protein
MLLIAAAMAVVCASHPIPNQGARHRGDLFSVALARLDATLSCADGTDNCLARRCLVSGGSGMGAASAAMATPCVSA